MSRSGSAAYHAGHPASCAASRASRSTGRKPRPRLSRCIGALSTRGPGVHERRLGMLARAASPRTAGLRLQAEPVAAVLGHHERVVLQAQSVALGEEHQRVPAELAVGARRAAPTHAGRTARASALLLLADAARRRRRGARGRARRSGRRASICVRMRQYAVDEVVRAAVAPVQELVRPVGSRSGRARSRRAAGRSRTKWSSRARLRTRAAAANATPPPSGASAPAGRPRRGTSSDRRRGRAYGFVVQRTAEPRRRCDGSTLISSSARCRLSAAGAPSSAVPTIATVLTRGEQRCGGVRGAGAGPSASASLRTSSAPGADRSARMGGLLDVPELAEGRRRRRRSTLRDRRPWRPPNRTRGLSGQRDFGGMLGPMDTHHRSNRSPRTGPAPSASSRTPTTWSSAPPPPSRAGPARARRSSTAW